MVLVFRSAQQVELDEAGHAFKMRLARKPDPLEGFLLALSFVLAQPDCQSNGSPPTWTDPIDSVAAVSAIGAMAAGLGALILRRWIAALISLAVCPVALLLVLASTCVFD